jgi:DNA-binding IclR family transcriptional regulator
VPRGSPQTERLIETIELLAARRHVGATATAIARHLNVDRATCYPMLRELCHFGWLIRDAPTKRFFLGPALIAVGATATTAVDVIDVARPYMAELADDTDLACVLVCVSAHELIVAEIAHPQNGRRPTLGLQIADTFPLRAPLGAVLVAWDDETTRTSWLGDGASRRTADREQRLRDSLRIIRRRGFAVEALAHPRDLQREVADARNRSMTRRETQATIERVANELGDELLVDNLRTRGPMRILTVSAPIFSAIGQAKAALCLYDPPGMVQGIQAQALGDKLAATAAQVSATLIAPPPLTM